MISNVFDYVQQQRRGSPGDSGQQADDDDRASEFEVAPCHQLNLYVKRPLSGRKRGPILLSGFNYSSRPLPAERAPHRAGEILGGRADAEPTAFELFPPFLPLLTAPPLSEPVVSGTNFAPSDISSVWVSVLASGPPCALSGQTTSLIAPARAPDPCCQRPS